MPNTYSGIQLKQGAIILRNTYRGLVVGDTGMKYAMTSFMGLVFPVLTSYSSL